MSVKKEASGRRSVEVEVEVPGTPEEVWQAIATGPGISSWFVPAEFEERGGRPVALTTALGTKGLGVGQHWTAPPGVPAFSGVAEYLSQSPYDALLRLDKPGPGVAALGAFNFGGQSMVALNFYLYGGQATETAAREKPLWQAWIQERLPTPAQTSQSD